MAGWRAKIIRRTVRVRREKVLMRLLTVMVSGGTSRRVSCPIQDMNTLADRGGFPAEISCPGMATGSARNSRLPRAGSLIFYSR